MDQIEITEESSDSSNALLGSLRRVLMAGIGAFVLAQEEIEDFLGKLVDRGEIADTDARKLLNDLVDGRVRMVQDGTKRAEGELDKRIETVLSRLNIPSKGEIDSLSTKIAELSDKVDELNFVQHE
ncbi:MAG: phasin family protein [Chloroflexota bacterium]